MKSFASFQFLFTRALLLFHGSFFFVCGLSFCSTVELCQRSASLCKSSSCFSLESIAQTVEKKSRLFEQRERARFLCSKLEKYGEQGEFEKFKELYESGIECRDKVLFWNIAFSCGEKPRRGEECSRILTYLKQKNEKKDLIDENMFLVFKMGIFFDGINACYSVVSSLFLDVSQGEIEMTKRVVSER